MSLITRCSVFKDHTAGATGLVAPPPLCSGHKKALVPRARQRAAATRPIWAPLTRRLSSWSGSKKRPRSIDRDGPLVQESPAAGEAEEAPLAHLQDLSAEFCRGQVRRSPSSASPSSLTAPWLSSRRASLVLDLERREEIGWGRCTSPSSPERSAGSLRRSSSGISSGRPCSTWSRLKWASAPPRPPLPSEPLHDPPAPGLSSPPPDVARLLLAQEQLVVGAHRLVGNRSSACRTSPPAAPSHRRSCRATCSSSACRRSRAGSAWSADRLLRHVVGPLDVPGEEQVELLVSPPARRPIGPPPSRNPAGRDRAARARRSAGRLHPLGEVLPLQEPRHPSSSRAVRTAPRPACPATRRSA